MHGVLETGDIILRDRVGILEFAVRQRHLAPRIVRRRYVVEAIRVEPRHVQVRELPVVLTRLIRLPGRAAAVRVGCENASPGQQRARERTHNEDAADGLYSLLSHGITPFATSGPSEARDAPLLILTIRGRGLDD